MSVTSVVITDCGSTTTKGIWFGRVDGAWKVIAHAEAPTTVEKPVADVTIGAINAIRTLGLSHGKKIVDEDLSQSRLLINTADDLPEMYLSTSSAGGGLQMVVMGIVANISGKSAEKAALGAGAIVQKVIALDSGYQNYEASQLIRELRPDIILLAGGTNDGASEQVIELAEILLLAEPKSRFETDLKVPVVYAGNNALTDKISELLNDTFQVQFVENVRSLVNQENLLPARNVIHDIFLDHVMSQAPGYRKLQEMVSKPIVPTPVAVSKMIEKASAKLGKTMLAVDIGGATTDIFSIKKNQDNGTFLPVHRSVSANLGMSYSIGNVVDLAGIDSIRRWVPFEIENSFLKNSLWNKMIRPTTLPENLLDLHIEQAAAREALSLSFDHHIELEDDFDIAAKTVDIADIFNSKREEKFSMFDVDMIIGSGGVLSHAPNRSSAGLMLIDSFKPLGITFLGIDSIFMLPHLGVLSETDADAAVELLFSECIVPLGSVICPKVKSEKIKLGQELFSIRFVESGEVLTIKFGEMKKISLPEKSRLEIEIVSKHKSCDFALPLKKSFEVEGGLMGLLFDGRGGQQDRLLQSANSIDLLKKWMNALEIDY